MPSVRIPERGRTRTSRRGHGRRSALLVSLIYGLVATLWIIASDRLIAILFADSAQLAVAGSVKGVVYVVVTSLLLFLLLDNWRAPAPPEGDTSNANRPVRMRVAFLALALVVPLVGYVVVQVHGRQIEAEALAALDAVAELKTREIQTWLSERDGDGRALMRSTGFAQRIRRWLAEGDLHERELVADRLEALQSAVHYEGVVLLDRHGEPLLAAGDRRDAPAALRPIMASALAAADVQRSNLYRDAQGRLHLDWVVPIRGPAAEVPEALAFVVLHVEPDRVLFPLIQSWHRPSATAESFLVRREGDDVVFLNELRHRPGPALSFRLPIATAALPAATVARDPRPRALSATDYRGEPVLAAVRPIPDTTWHLVAKVDRDEVMRPLNALVQWVSLVTLCAIASVAALILTLWDQQRRTDLLAAQARTAEHIRELNLQLERRVAERTAQLAAANSELESFAYAVAHDLKAPLRGIIGYSQLLDIECRNLLNGDGKEFLRNIHAGAAQMHQLIDDLLTYARIERHALKAESTPLPAFVASILAEYRQEFDSAGVELSVKLPDVTLAIDREGLSVALRNVIDNALKFSRHAAPPRIAIDGRIDAGSVIISIRDNGIGFDMKFHDRIFEMFNRLESRSEYPGTGVGLALVRKAMQRMEGRACAESHIGEGATFHLLFPRQTPSGAARADEPLSSGIDAS